MIIRRIAVTSKQQAALADFRRWATHSHTIDTETTGFRGEVFELSVRHISGALHAHLKMRPSSAWEDGARQMHQHRLGQIMSCPQTLHDHAQTLREISLLTPLVAYNASFDNARLNASTEQHGLGNLGFEAECAMLSYTRLRAEDYQSSRGGIRQRSFKLEVACHDEGIALSDLDLHSADHDAVALQRLIVHVAQNWN